VSTTRAPARQAGVRSHNLALVLWSVVQASGSRADVASRTSLTKAAVSSMVDTMSVAFHPAYVGSQAWTIHRLEKSVFTPPMPAQTPSLRCSPRTAGTAQAYAERRGRNDLPCRPALDMVRSAMTAARAR